MPIELKYTNGEAQVVGFKENIVEVSVPVINISKNVELVYFSVLITRLRLVMARHFGRTLYSFTHSMPAT